VVSAVTGLLAPVSGGRQPRGAWVSRFSLSFSRQVAAQGRRLDRRGAPGFRVMEIRSRDFEPFEAGF
jgi:hypothetical protein